jgi:hypothetical protein
LKHLTEVLKDDALCLSYCGVEWSTDAGWELARASSLPIPTYL